MRREPSAARVVAAHRALSKARQSFDLWWHPVRSIERVRARIRRIDRLGAEFMVAGSAWPARLAERAR